MSTTIDNTRAANYIQYVRENFNDFLLKLPFQSVFGWSDTYCQAICKTIYLGNSDDIYSMIKQAKIKFINVQIGPKIDYGGYGSVFKSTMKKDGENINVIVKAAYPPEDLEENSPQNPQNRTHSEEIFVRDTIFMRSIYEAIIGIIMHTIFQNMDGVSAPTIYKCGYIAIKHPWEEMELLTTKGNTVYPAIVMSPLQKHGKDIKSLEKEILEQFFLKTAEILNRLQKLYHFSHRDLNTGNIRYNPDNQGCIEIFDFGESCFKWPNSNYALQLPESENYSMLNEHVKLCNNPSFDLSMLILSCYNGRGGKFSSFYINKVANDIFNEIKKKSTEKINAISWIKLYKRYDLMMECCIPQNFIENYNSTKMSTKNRERVLHFGNKSLK